MKQTEVNLHCHTFRCRHALGSMEEFCEAALAGGLKILAFTDHAPFPDDRPLPDRMPMAEIPDYVSDVERMRKRYPDLAIIRGLELDIVPDMALYGKLFREQTPFELLLGSAHRIMYQGKEVFCFARDLELSEEIFAAFLDAEIQALESGVADVIAHPDAASGKYFGPVTPRLERIIRRLAAGSRERNVPLEVNANGIRKGLRSGGDRYAYPWEAFWKIVSEERSPVIVASDAHRPDQIVCSSLAMCFEFADRMNLSVVNAPFAEKILKKRKAV